VASATHVGAKVRRPNRSQKILILTGDAGWGKSSLVKILGSAISVRDGKVDNRE